MSRVFRCNDCQAAIPRFPAAPALTACPHCRSSQVVELVASGVPVSPPPVDQTREEPWGGTERETHASSAASEGLRRIERTAEAQDQSTQGGSVGTARELDLEPFACLRGEPCTRIRGGNCPGGAGC